MSAIAGLWRFDGRADAATDCGRMLTAQAIYGPHNAAAWDGGQISLGRRLFRTLPEDVYDRQPLVVDDGRRVLVADVRLDNRDDLLGDLRIPGERARGLCDAAILLAAWERWEEDCFGHLVGDYAFALWDAAAQTLALARDPLGRRPLHYHVGQHFLAFASMPKGLHALPEVPYGPDEEQVAGQLALMPEIGSGSFFKGVQIVEAGHVIKVTPRGLSKWRHWAPARRTLRLKTSQEYGEQLREHLDRAVLARLRGAEQQVGAHLSAGWDSSAVTTSAALLLAPTNGQVVAFTVVPAVDYRDDPQYASGRTAHEGGLAAVTAALYPNIEHVIVPPTGRSPLADLDRQFYLYDRPIMNLCNNVYNDELNRQAQARNIKVMLVGDFGNSAFSITGLEWLPELVAGGQWLRWLREATALNRHAHLRWRHILATSVGRWIPGPVWNALMRRNGRRISDISQDTCINPTRWGELRLLSKLKAAGADIYARPNLGVFESILHYFTDHDFGNYQKGALAGYGIDLRDPTTDIRLVEFCLSTPPEQFLEGGRPRALSRRALNGRVPDAVLDSPRGYFGADWHEALSRDRQTLAREIDRLAANGPAARALDIAKMRKLVENWPTEGWESPEIFTAYRLGLLRGVSAGHFLLKASGGNA